MSAGAYLLVCMGILIALYTTAVNRFLCQSAASRGPKFDRRLLQSFAMGIRGLQRFLRKRKLYTRQEIGGNLVIDGSQFCHYYYKQLELDRINGGQYPKFRQEVTEFFCKLRQCDIKSHVVFEGVDKGQKLTDDYIKEKARSKHEESQILLEQRPFHCSEMPELPQLAYTVVFNVLVCMGIPMYVGDGEGDETCVQIANFLKCPVLSDDSDFYLFDICQGYIELDHVQSQLIELDHVQQSPWRLSVDVYSREPLMRCFRKNNSDGLYLIPVIMDKLNDEAFARSFESVVGRMSYPHIEWVFSYLSRSSVSCIRDVTEKMALTQSFESAKAYYNPAPQNPVELLSKPINEFNLPDWFLREHRNHNMPYMLVDALVNKKQHHSNSPVSKYIRQCCYRILGVPKVKEYSIERDRAVISMVNCADSLQPCYHISDVPQVCEDQRKSFLFSIFCCPQEKLVGVEDKEKLLVCSVTFWKTQTHPPVHVVKALLACFVLLSTSSDKTVCDARDTAIKKYKESDNWLHDRQLFLDWQSVYNDGLALRRLLQCPLAEICPSKIYDGKIVMSLASRTDRIDSAIRRLGISMEKYHTLLRIVRSVHV